MRNWCHQHLQFAAILTDTNSEKAEKLHWWLVTDFRKKMVTLISSKEVPLSSLSNLMIQKTEY